MSSELQSWIPKATIINIKDDEHWLAERRKYVTASELSVIMGPRAVKSRQRIAQEKLGKKESFKGNHVMRMGQLMEEANIKAFSIATGFPTLLTHAMVVRGPLSCTLDALVRLLCLTDEDDLLNVEWGELFPESAVGEVLTLDGKNVRSESEHHWKNGPPGNYWWQMQGQSYCCHLTGSILMAKIDAHRLTAHYVAGDEFAQEAAVERAQWFLDNLEDIANGSCK